MAADVKKWSRAWRGAQCTLRETQVLENAKKRVPNEKSMWGSFGHWVLLLLPLKTILASSSCQNATITSCEQCMAGNISKEILLRHLKTQRRPLEVKD